ARRNAAHQSNGHWVSAPVWGARPSARIRPDVRPTARTLVDCVLESIPKTTSFIATPLLPDRRAILTPSFAGRTAPPDQGASTLEVVSSRAFLSCPHLYLRRTAHSRHAWQNRCARRYRGRNLGDQRSERRARYRHEWRLGRPALSRCGAGASG